MPIVQLDKIVKNKNRKREPEQECLVQEKEIIRSSV